jgi:serine kinase of HPr protein (carbohydrate metabolism regulator)
MTMTETLHASTVAIDGRAVMLLGAPGAGKSDLALRLLDRGAALVADDCTVLDRAGDALLASAPATIAGRIEVRGLGILDWPHVSHVPVALAVALGPERDRMPEPRRRTWLGVSIAEVTIDPHHASAPIKVALAVAATGAAR